MPCGKGKKGKGKGKGKGSRAYYGITCFKSGHRTETRRPSFFKMDAGEHPCSLRGYGVDLSVNDRFPSYLCCKPNMGDIIESLSGRRLSVKGVITRLR